ncbi:protein STICHEL-like 2 isoform X2 [Aristolochia californica]|uniref:protein STICHEL-like 2 isoform X2 n=1 Tax=Aristolochia californica TaxID=171875 RepID=UPI0035E36543
MSEKRRHSVDIPLSKTIVAMRRVRSLRDPTTNSMSKFPAFIDHDWETNSCNGVLPAAEHGSQKSVGSRNRVRRERLGSDSEWSHGARKLPKSKLHSYKKSGGVVIEGGDLVSTKEIDKLVRARLSLDGVHEMKLLEGLSSIDRGNKELDLTWVSHSGNCLKEDADSCSEHNNLGLEVSERPGKKTRKKTEYTKPLKPSKVVDDGARSCVGSPSLTLSDARMDASSVSTSIFADEETEFLGSSHRGCGISCCWSRTPKFRNSNQHTDVEENHPLLLAEAKDMNHTESACFRRDLALYSDYTRSLSDKFRPRSFDEVVGQDVVTQSLLSAILKGRIASLYLFHGPRGTGKTSTARIFAAAVNCLSMDLGKPCGFCRHCVLFFSGRCRDAREVDSAKMNRTSRIKALIKNAAIPPISSRFKVFIIDECQLLRGEIWTLFLNALDELPRHVVFVMITDDLDKLPRNYLSRCQKYHFPKIREGDIVTKLVRICVEENFEFDKAALEFIATKSNGSVRDAETMLDQLGLLGKQITMSLVYELNGIISDDELLELLDLALSSDTSNTVRRARELMRSRVDPMQLISQLANLIMDILAGRCQSGNSSAGRNFLGRVTFDLQKLRHALKVLSETEKQLKMSKSQTTWLTVALLQFSAGDSSLSDGSDLRACSKSSYHKEDGFCSTSKVENFDCSASHLHNLCESQRSRIQVDTAGKLEMIWSRAVEKCQSNRLKKFLRKEGKLSSVCVGQDLAIVEVDFGKQDHVFKAEKSWKVIASSLQLVLGCNVEIRINLILSPSTTKSTKVKKLSFSLLSCSRGMSEDLGPANVVGDNHSDGSRPSSAAVKIKVADKISSIDGKDLVAIRDAEGNTLSTVTNTSHRLVQAGLPDASESEFDTSVQKKGPDSADRCQVIQELETQPSCFSKTFKLKKILNTSEAACTICLRIQPEKFETCVPQKTSQETYFHKNDPFFLSSSSNTQMTSSNISPDEDRSSRDPEIDAMMHSWRSPKSPAQVPKKQQRRSHLVGWVLPCSTAQEFSEA